MMSETEWKAVENVVIFSERSIVIKLSGNVHDGLGFTMASSCVSTNNIMTSFCIEKVCLTKI